MVPTPCPHQKPKVHRNVINTGLTQQPTSSERPMAAPAFCYPPGAIQPRPLPPSSSSCLTCRVRRHHCHMEKQISNIIFYHFTWKYTPGSFKLFLKNTIIAADTMNNLPRHPNLQSLFRFLCQKCLCTGGLSESGSKQGLYIARKPLLSVIVSPIYISFKIPVPC